MKKFAPQLIEPASKQLFSMLVPETFIFFTDPIKQQTIKIFALRKYYPCCSCKEIFNFLSYFWGFYSKTLKQNSKHLIIWQQVKKNGAGNV